MNERIVKLFMQSVDSNYIPLPIEDHIPSWTEKFAELIVRECCIIAGPEDSYRDDWFSAKTDSVEKIKQHFGVEE